jgi:D-serine deaminase-like pyridoxal phosphate-dependent protein
MNAVFGDLALPAMLLKETALENNLSVMARYATDHGFLLAPHGKTTMAPKLFQRQLDAGAWAITVANMTQAAVAYDAGAERVLVANEVVSQADAQAMAEFVDKDVTPPTGALVAGASSELSKLSPGQPAGLRPVNPIGEGRRELYCLVDSVEGVELLDRNLGRAGLSDRGVGVFVELGVPGGRTGARSEDEAVAVAAAVVASGRLHLVGVEGYEGLLAPDRSMASLAKVDGYLDGLRRLTRRLADDGAFSSDGPILVSAGGSRFFDRVAAILGENAQWEGLEVRLVVRSGCYLVHDHGTYAKASPLSPPAQDGPALMGALEVWADVLSVPEPGLAILGLGRRDVSYDLGLPVTLSLGRRESGRVEKFAGWALSDLNDQHGYLEFANHPVPVKVGDRVGFGISHPCTAIDKWRTILLVDDDYEVRDEIATFFH